MKIYKEPNLELEPDFMCPICKTNSKEPIVLVGVAGTEEDGVFRVTQIHTRCINLFIMRDKKTNKRIVFHAEEVD